MTSIFKCQTKKIVFWLAPRFVFLLLLGCSVAVRAERLPVKIYTSADGLGSSFVDFLMRDSRGFMWFATRDGLSRFDGSRFVTYKIGGSNSTPGVESVYETRDGMYWISTTGGTFRFDPQKISPPGASAPRLDAEFVTGERGNFFEDSKGNLWFISGAPARLIEQEDGKIVLQTIELNLPPRTDVKFHLNDIAEAADGSLWMFTSWGLVRCLPDNRTVFYPMKLPIVSTGSNSTMIADKNGRIWIAWSGGVLALKPEPPEFFAGGEQLITKSLEPTEVLKLKPDAPAPLPKKGGEIFRFTNDSSLNFVENSYPKYLFQTSDGDVWITAENNLLQFSDGAFHLHTSAEGLPSVMARMTEDAAGNLWIGGQTGLARLDRGGVVTFGASDGLNSPRIFAVGEAADGALYFGTRDFYLSRFDGGKFQTVHPSVDPQSYVLWTSRFAYRSSDGDWWILTSEKLYRFSGVRNFAELDKRQPTKIYTEADGLKANGMFQIFEDSAGDIWVSSRGGGDKNGVSRLKKGDERFYTFSEADGLPNNRAFSSAAEDSFGNIWFGFYEGGAARFDGEKFELFGEKENLPGGGVVITDLHVDGKKRLWLSSARAGLVRVDDTSAKTPTFVNLTTADGLTSNNVRTITEDRFGRIYVGTVRGVDRLSPDTGRIKHYSVSDGLAADFVVDSHCDKNGDLWFATNDGLSRLTPQPDEKASAPPVLLGGLQIAGEPQSVLQFGSAQIRTNDLQPEQNNLQIDFFALDFRAGETLRYQYKLEGADADWSLPSEQRTRTFANLSPGSYRFLVRAVNSEGIASERPASVSFVILPPFYARWWFVLTAAILTMVILSGFYYYRTKNLREINRALSEAKNAEENLRKAKEERLAELEKVRSRIATDLHDDIGASLTQITVLSEVARAQSKGNGAGESLTRISNVSNELVEAMSDIVWSINPAKDRLSDLTQRMRRFAADVLPAKGIRFQFDTPEASEKTIVGTNVRREMFLVFKELINNVVKHSEAKTVRISLKISGENLTLEIADDGRGFDSSGLDPREATDSQFAMLNPDSMGGNGIRNIWRRTREMNGEIRFDSQIGRGAKTILTLPLDAARTGGETTSEIG